MCDILGVVDVWCLGVVDVGVCDIGGVVVDVYYYCIVFLCVFGVVMYGCCCGFFEEVDVVEVGGDCCVV